MSNLQLATSMSFGRVCGIVAWIVLTYSVCSCKRAKPWYPLHGGELTPLHEAESLLGEPPVMLAGTMPGFTVVPSPPKLEWAVGPRRMYLKGQIHELSGEGQTHLRRFLESAAFKQARDVHEKSYLIVDSGYSYLAVLDPQSSARVLRSSVHNGETGEEVLQSGIGAGSVRELDRAWQKIIEEKKVLSQMVR